MNQISYRNNMEEDVENEFAADRILSDLKDMQTLQTELSLQEKFVEMYGEDYCTRMNFGPGVDDEITAKDIRVARILLEQQRREFLVGSLHELKQKNLYGLSEEADGTRVTELMRAIATQITHMPNALQKGALFKQALELPLNSAAKVPLVLGLGKLVCECMDKEQLANKESFGYASPADCQDWALIVAAGLHGDQKDSCKNVMDELEKIYPWIVLENLVDQGAAMTGGVRPTANFDTPANTYQLAKNHTRSPN